MNRTRSGVLNLTLEWVMLWLVVEVVRRLLCCPLRNANSSFRGVNRSLIPFLAGTLSLFVVRRCILIGLELLPVRDMGSNITLCRYLFGRLCGRM